MGSLQRPRGMLFDLGNTLLKEERFDRALGTRHVLSFANNPRGVSADEICGLVAELEGDLRERREASWLELSPWTVHRLIYEPYGITFDRPFHEVEREFLRAAAHFEPTSGIRQLLGSLVEADVVLGVVSNSTFSSQTLSWQIGEFGLSRFFRFVMSSADYVVRKPHPAIFAAAVRKLGTDPAETWFVGDSPRYDVAGAATAGMTSVLYRPSGGGPVEPAADIQVRSWQELGDELVGTRG